MSTSKVDTIYSNNTNQYQVYVGKLYFISVNRPTVFFIPSLSKLSITYLLDLLWAVKNPTIFYGLSSSHNFESRYFTCFSLITWFKLRLTDYAICILYYIAERTDNSPEKLAQVDKLFTNLQMEEEVFCDTMYKNKKRECKKFLDKNSVS